MEYVKGSIHNTSLPILIINEDQTYVDYPQIGCGDEASVHKYNDDIAFKIFSFIRDKTKLPRKYEKIELLGKIQDESACLPIGLVGYENELKEGYYCNLVKYNNATKDFTKLEFLHDMKRILNYIIQADEAIRRFHKMGFILGDIKDDNIMIDINDKVKFVDTDNWMYGDYGFDVVPGRIFWLSSTYNKEFSLLDNDRFVFTIMALQLFIENTVISFHRNDLYFKKLIEYMDVSPEVKDGLRIILSDAHNKPYVGPILEKINPERPLLTREQTHRLNRIYN